MTGKGFTVTASRFRALPAGKAKGAGTEVQAIGNVKLVSDRGTATAPRVDFLLAAGQRLDRATAAGPVHFVAKLAAKKGSPNPEPTATFSGQTFTYTRAKDQSVLSGGVQVEARLGDGSTLTGSSDQAVLNHATGEARFQGHASVTKFDATTKAAVFTLRNLESLTVNLKDGTIEGLPPSGSQVEANVTTPQKPKSKG
jgi:hypothetical protein